jgi:CopG family nickel-responsive transcriptional regulator
MSQITRFGISMDSKLLRRFDRLIGEHGYATRSEAFRDLVRDRLVKEEWQEENVETVGTITIIYDHHKRDLTETLTEQQHRWHDSVISTMHVHLDKDNCLEVLAVKGKAKEIKKIADDLISTKGVKHGKLVMTSTGKNL